MFRHIDRRERVLSRHSGRLAARMIRRYWETACMDAAVAARSLLRSGFATMAAAAGRAILDEMRQKPHAQS